MLKHANVDKYAAEIIPKQPLQFAKSMQRR